MKLISFFILIITATYLNSCKVLPFHKVDCKPFTIRGEVYWFPFPEEETVTFVNHKNIEKTYIIVENYISHTTKYTSDMGCACNDRSAMLLIHENDSIWFANQLISQEHQNEKYYEDIVFVIDGVRSGFYETAKSHLETYSIDTITFSDVEVFECPKCDIDLSVKKLYRVKNLGVIQFELVDGEVWFNKNLSDYRNITQEQFRYYEYECD
jgi:hypothetical protein